MAPQTEETKLVAWLEEQLGGAVERCERQARWRPAWFVDLRRDGQRLPLYVRGDRGEGFPPWPIEYEAEVLKILERAGVPVPHVFGVCADPHAIVMSQAPGHANLATADSEAERASVVDHLAEIMAAMHGLDIEPFARMGMKVPKTAEEMALNYFGECEAIYLSGKQAPDPRVEFVRRWVRRNVPQRDVAPRFAHMDAGQFVFERGRITAMVDFEVACLGDPVADLAALRSRAISEPMGDLRPLFQRYAALTGSEVDRDLLGFHSVAWMICVHLVIAPALAAPSPNSDFIEYLSWYVGCLLAALGDLAELLDLPLEPPEAAVSQPSRWAQAYELCAEKLSGLPLDAAAGADYELGAVQRLVTFVQRMDAHGAAFEAEYLQDVRNLLGLQAKDWKEADRVVEAFVLTTGPEHDRALTLLFHRWARRQARLLEGLVNQPMLTQRLQPLSELSIRAAKATA